jgi:hypothetical protein
MDTNSRNNPGYDNEVYIGRVERDGNSYDTGTVAETKTKLKLTTRFFYRYYQNTMRVHALGSFEFLRSHSSLWLGE